MSKLIEIINRVSSQLLKIDDESHIYQIMNDGIREIIPGVYFLITKLQPNDMNFRITHSFGFDRFINPIQTLLGKNPFEIDFPFSDISNSRLEAFNNGKLFHLEGGLYDLVSARINKTICLTIERMLDISEIYTISFITKKSFFGGASFFITKDINESGLINEEIKSTIETIAFQVSYAINNLRHIQLLKEKENPLGVIKLFDF